MTGLGLSLKINPAARRRQTTLTGFAPASFFAAGEQGAWWDPSDLSSMFQDSAGTTPAAVDSPVGKINDKSGRGNHLIQATAASRPVLRYTTGRYYLEFDGSDDGMAIAALNLSGGDSVMLCMGVRKLADTGATTYLCELTGNVTATQGGLALRHDNINGDAFDFLSRGSALAGASSAAVVVNTTAVLTGIGDISADTCRLRVNQTETSIATDQGTGNYANAAFSLGRRVNFANPTNMRFYGAILRGVVPSAGELAAVEAWMNWRTGAY